MSEYENLRKKQEETISLIDKSQLEHSDNRINVREDYAQDPSTPHIFSEVTLDRPSDDAPKSDANPVIESEMERFCSSIPIDEKTLRENKRTIAKAGL